MAPILGIWTPNLIPNWGFVNPSKEYFIKFELFSSPKGRECNQEKAKIFKRHTYATRPPPHPHLHRLSNHWYLHTPYSKMVTTLLFFYTYVA